MPSNMDNPYPTSGCLDYLIKKRDTHRRSAHCVVVTSRERCRRSRWISTCNGECFRHRRYSAHSHGPNKSSGKVRYLFLMWVKFPVFQAVYQHPNTTLVQVYISPASVYHSNTLLVPHAASHWNFFQSLGSKYNDFFQVCSFSMTYSFMSPLDTLIAVRMYDHVTVVGKSRATRVCRLLSISLVYPSADD